MNKTKRAWTARMRREGNPESLIFFYRLFGYQSKLAFFFFYRFLDIQITWFKFEVFFKKSNFFTKPRMFFFKPVTEDNQKSFVTQCDSPKEDD